MVGRGGGWGWRASLAVALPPVRAQYHADREVVVVVGSAVRAAEELHLEGAVVRYGTALDQDTPATRYM